MSKADAIHTEGWKQAQEKTKITWKLKRQSNEKKYYENPSICNNCSEILSYDKRHHKFCSQRCNAIKSNSGYNRHSGNYSDKRNCVVCGTSLHGKCCHQTFCSKKCWITHKEIKNIEVWVTTGMYKKKQLTSVGRGYYINIRGNCCEMCGWNKINPYTGKSPLNVDHIDGDCTNNILENIRVLCPSCHSLTSTYGSLNKGKSKRVKRYKANPI